MNAQDLKNSILQLAIQGKLVEQREEEGTAKELLEKIEAEKKQLIKEGKIKKQKDLPAIKENEIPFDIPDNWEWVKLEQLATITGGYAFKSTNYTEQGVRVIRISDFNEKGFVDNKIVRHIYDDSLDMFLLEKNNILLCMTGGTVGKSLFVKEIEEPMMTNQRVATIKISASVLPEYINYIFLSPIIQSVIRLSKNSTNDNISMDTIKSFLIPLPPLEEQTRIVAKIEELISYVDKYDEAYSEVEELNKKFPEDMQKSILQYAIQGKLVEQREEEGTAEELYKQIQEEKKKLIKEGKIKKTKELPEITEDEIPFDIPENWVWVRLGDVIHLTSGQDMPPNKYNDVSEGIPYLTGASNIQDGKMIINRWTLEPKAIAYKGDVLLTCKGTVGKTVILYEDEAHIARQIMSLKAIIIDAEFVKYFVKSYVNILKSKAKSMIPGIERKDVIEAVLPLPPLLEQKRIVAKIEELLPYTKQLGK